MRTEEYPHRLGIRLDEVQREQIQSAAALAGLSMSEWSRTVLVEAAHAERVAAAVASLTRQSRRRRAA